MACLRPLHHQHSLDLLNGILKDGQPGHTGCHTMPDRWPPGGAVSAVSAQLYADKTVACR
jgi:hypothetical protein